MIWRRSLKHHPPAPILLSLPLSVPFALLSLWATALLSISIRLWNLVLFGVVKKNSIADRAYEQPSRPRMIGRAICRGNRERLRPI